MKKLIQMPPEVAQVFGSAAPKFVDYIADVMSNQADEVLQVSILSFERTLTREIAAVRNEMSELRADMRSEIADIRTEMADLRADVRLEIAELRAELKDEIHTQIAGVNGQIVGLHQNIAGLHGLISGLHGQISGLHEKFSDMHKQISGVHKQIADVHKQISSQTKWLLAMMMAAVTLYPIINQLVQRYL